MEIIDSLLAPSWYGVSPVWICILCAVLTYILYSKLSNYFYQRSIYSASRVKEYNDRKKSSWNKKQSEIAPDLEPEEEKQRENKPIPFAVDRNDTKKDNRKFKKIFGMDTLGAAPCKTGG